MSLPVVFRRIARLEFEESIAWYDAQQAGLGVQFAAEIENLLERISDSPQQFPHVRNRIRRAVSTRFPYTVHYITEKERIVVLAIFHVKRNPTQLEGR
ncbi:MAG TPA: type II toxin-antitoxin system RelE/ParE family toxin [Pyrinomonadaceae bacterium]|jgi:plasmid stabilization system protein ParE|nr:type II toxin-antitoxin system RelE/ParE family toxin [Pyrinomonadaceae bacterium]